MEKVKNIKQFERFMNELKIISRTMVDDKRAIVLGLIELNYIVAVIFF